MNFEKILKNVSVPRETCEYWDIRIESVVQTEIRYDDFDLVDSSIKPSVGAFIRIYSGGKWYYLSTTKIEDLSAQVIATASRAKGFDIETIESHVKPYNTTSADHHCLKAAKTRFDRVPLEKKKNICTKHFESLKSFEKLNSIKVVYRDEYKEKYFLSSENVSFVYDFNQCGITFRYTVKDGEQSFNDKFQFYASDIEQLESFKSEALVDNIKESHLFLEAKTIEAGDYAVLMSSEVVGVFAHESFGHKSEADFMLGDDGAKEYWKIGTKVGSECLSIVDYGATYGTSGYCPIDDEGYPTQKTYLIKNGLLAGRLHNQLTAQVFDEPPTGNGRAMNFEFEPIVRMTNTYVEGGKKTVDELIANVELGIFVKDFKHGSGMSTFTIAPLKSYMIRDGKIAEAIHVSVISGTVFETLNRIEGCSHSENIFSSSFGGCGKMEQYPLPVAFGGPKVLVNKMMVS